MKKLTRSEIEALDFRIKATSEMLDQQRVEKLKAECERDAIDARIDRLIQEYAEAILAKLGIQYPSSEAFVIEFSNGPHVVKLAWGGGLDYGTEMPNVKILHRNKGKRTFCKVHDLYPLSILESARPLRDGESQALVRKLRRPPSPPASPSTERNE